MSSRGEPSMTRMSAMAPSFRTPRRPSMPMSFAAMVVALARISAAGRTQARMAL